MSERRFTEQQVADIIRRAAEAQRGSPPGEAPYGTLSASEVLRIGTELGVDPAALEAAMGDTVTWTSHDDTSSSMVEVTFERRIPEAPTGEDFAEVVKLFEPRTGWGSIVIRSEGMLSYKSVKWMSSCAVTLAGSDHATCLKVRSNSYVRWASSFITIMIATKGIDHLYPELFDRFFFALLVPDSLVLPVGSAPRPEAWVLVSFALVLVLVWAVSSRLETAIIRNTNRNIARLMDEFASGKAERARMSSTIPRLGAGNLELESDYQPEELRLNQTEDGR